MDSHMALLTHAVLRFSLPILPCFSFLGVLLSSLVSSHSISLFPIFCPPLATSNVDTFCSFFFFLNKHPFSRSSTKPWIWPTTQSCDPSYHGSRAWDTHSLSSTVSNKWQKTVTLHVWLWQEDRCKAHGEVLLRAWSHAALHFLNGGVGKE